MGCGVRKGWNKNLLNSINNNQFSMNTNDQIKPVRTTEEVIDDRRDAEIRNENKNVITAWLLIITELFYALMYGFFVQINEVKVTSSEEFVHTALLFILIVAGIKWNLCRFWAGFIEILSTGMELTRI